MKKQRDKFYLWGIIGFFICSILMVPEFFIARWIDQNNPGTFTKCFFALLTITILIFGIILTAKDMKNEKARKEYKKCLVEETKKKLTSKFQTVILNDITDIPKSFLKCQAKVNENGKIICRIHLDDFEVGCENYEEFLEHFSFVEEE